MTALVRVTRGVWRPEAQVADLTGRVSALLVGCPEGTVVSGATAARLHGLWLPPSLGERVEVIVRPDITRPADRARSKRKQVRARRQILQSDETMLLGGVPVTSEARTWLDLAARLGMADLVALGDSALRGQATSEQLARLIERAFHRPGVVRARAALPLLDARSRSRPESHVRYILHSGGLPRPEVNVAIHSTTGEWLSEPDLSYQDVRLAIEYNGIDHAEVDRTRRDITRELDVDERGGWRTVTFGPAEVFRRPDDVARHVRRLRRERGA